MPRGPGVQSGMNWRIHSAQLAAERAANAVHREMAGGLYGLATVAATVPFVGLLGNVLGIYGSFRGITGDKTSIMAAIAGSLSESLWPTAFGLAAGVASLAAYRYFTARLAGIDTETRDVIVQLPAWLHHSIDATR